MDYRDYTPEDLPAVQRIWKECGWISEEEAPILEDFFGVGHALVGLIDDSPECAVHHTPGTLRYLKQELPLGAVTAVTTSHIARQGGMALKLTAALLAHQAAEGMAVSALGIFDQGYYDKLGYGTCSYGTWIRFDPHTLKVSKSFRVPKRLDAKKDSDIIMQAMHQRRQGHGNVNLLPLRLMKAELAFIEKPFGLGYFDGENGELTHFIFGSTEGENGPYVIRWMAYQNGEQFRELLALIRSLSDQVNTISMLEPTDLQMQDFLDRPIRNRRGTAKSQHENRANALAYQQLRILDLEACLNRTQLQTPPVAFNLKLSDPISAYLPASAWQGIAGEYIIELGAQSSVESGQHERLPTLSASVGAFSRFWLGVRSASSLAISDDLAGPPALLEALDDCVCLPTPHLAWDF